MSLKERAKQIKTDIPAVFLALRHRSTPMAARLLAGLAIGYALSPVDLIPDFIPVLGYLDDVVLLPVLITLTIRLIPAEVLEECRRNAEDIWTDGKPKKWYYAAPIVGIWLLLLCIIVKAIRA